MKRFDLKSIALGFVIGTVGLTTVFAANGIKSASFNSSNVYFYGKEVPLQNQLVSIVKEGETNAQIYMPVRELLEYMNFIVEWDSKDSSINLTMKGNTGNNNNTYNYDYSGLSQNEADAKAITIINNSGTWGSEIDSLIPHMTANGIENLVDIYLSKQLFPGITPPEGARQVATRIDTALKYMTTDAKEKVENILSSYY